MSQLEREFNKKIVVEISFFLYYYPQIAKSCLFNEKEKIYLFIEDFAFVEIHFVYFYLGGLKSRLTY